MAAGLVLVAGLIPADSCRAAEPVHAGTDGLEGAVRGEIHPDTAAWVAPLMAHTQRAVKRPRIGDGLITHVDQLDVDVPSRNHVVEDAVETSPTDDGVEIGHANGGFGDGDRAGAAQSQGDVVQHDAQNRPIGDRTVHRCVAARMRMQDEVRLNRNAHAWFDVRRQG